MKLILGLLISIPAFAQVVTDTYTAANGITDVSYDGGGGPVSYLTTAPAGLGTATISGVTSNINTVHSSSITGSGSGAGSTIWVLWPGNASTNQITFTRTYTPGTDTFQVDFAVRNDSTGTLEGVNLAQVLRMSTPTQASNFIASGCTCQDITRNQQEPIFYLSQGGAGTWGSFAAGLVTPNVNAEFLTNYTTSGQTVFDVRMIVPQRANPESPVFSLANGATATFSLIYKFSSSVVDSATLAAVPLAAYRAAFPFLSNVTDHRSWGTLFVADTTKRSAINPYGYFSSAALDVIGNPTAFNTAKNAYVTGALNILNAQVPKPQGVIVWDLEGEEYNRFLSYFGHPAQLPTLAPEMDAIADAFFASFKNAGYKIGVTIRPNVVATGTLANLPVTCVGNPQAGCPVPGGSITGCTSFPGEMYIALDAARPNRSYGCANATDPFFPCISGSPPCMTQYGSPLTTPSSAGVYWQNFLTTYAGILAQLRVEIDYSIARWNMDMFYIDSDVTVLGATLTTQLWNDLKTLYPGLVMMPETSYDTMWGPVTPYRSDAVCTYRTPDAALAIYPYGSSLVDPHAITAFNTNGCGTPTTKTAAAVLGMQRGDNWMYPGWFGNGTTTFVKSLQTLAATANSSILITDTNTGLNRGFSATAYTACLFECFLRINFAATSGALHGSTTYCEIHGDLTCYQSGVATGAASVNLSGMTVYGFEYFYFGGLNNTPQFVSKSTAGIL